jgi:hypothetical protein
MISDRVAPQKQHLVWLLVAVGAVAVFATTYLARVSYAGSDPELSLLVSQALIEHGTVRLDTYASGDDAPLDRYSTFGEIKIANGHTYYVFPLGTSALAAPFVGLANLWGLDMTMPQDNYTLQNLLSALSCALIFGIVYRLAHYYLPVAPSLGIAAASVLGSSLVSTLGTAFWNFNLTIVCVMLALLLIARRHRLGIPPNAYVLGGLLFGAFFCRPSTATFIITVLAYLLVEDRRLLVRTAATAGGLLLAFLITSRVEYGQWLPDYYSAAKLTLHQTPPAYLLYGLFLSPSRGLLVFSPFLVVVLAALVWRFRDLRRERLVILSLAWIGLHVLLIARSTRWWGGHGFGPRVLTDLLPAFILLSVLVARAVLQHPRHLLRRLAVASYTGLALVALFINTYQGLFNPLTVRWNGASFEPDVDLHPEYLLDWRYPQFLASTGSLCARNADYKHKNVEPHYDAAAYYTPGEAVDYAGEAGNTAFVGWSKPEDGFRWSECPTAQLLVKLGEADRAKRYTLEFAAGAERAQVAQVSVNGTYVGELLFEETLPQTPVTREVALAGNLLRPNALNTIEISLPGAARVGPQDPRLLGLALTSFRIYRDD